MNLNRVRILYIIEKRKSLYSNESDFEFSLIAYRTGLPAAFRKQASVIIASPFVELAKAHQWL